MLLMSPDVHGMLLLRLKSSRHLWEAIGKDERKSEGKREREMTEARVRE